MIVFIYILILGAVILAVWGVSGLVRDIEMKKRIRLPGERERDKKLKARSFFTNLMPFTQKFLEKSKLEWVLKQQLDLAHVKIAPQEFFNIKLVVMVALLVLSSFAVGKFNPGFAVGALGIGYLLPDLWLRKKIAQRKYEIARVLPETVDLLGLCIEAGLDFTTAVRWIIDKVPNNPMVEEMSFVLEEIKWGKPRTQALKDMAKRLNIPEVTSFVNILHLAERMGTPVGEAFALLSEDTRLQRFHRGERYATQAPMKILIPLIFCILPVIAIVVGGPIFLQFMGGGLLKGIGH